VQRASCTVGRLKGINNDVGNVATIKGGRSVRGGLIRGFWGVQIRGGSRIESYRCRKARASPYGLRGKAVALAGKKGVVEGGGTKKAIRQGNRGRLWGKIFCAG